MAWHHNLAHYLTIPPMTPSQFPLSDEIHPAEFFLYFDDGVPELLLNQLKQQAHHYLNQYHDDKNRLFVMLRFLNPMPKYNVMTAHL